MFAERPDHASSTNLLAPRILDDRVVLVAAPDSKLAFKVPPGAKRATGEIGILPWTYDRTDGVDFSIEIESEGLSRSLFERRLEPKTCETDRGSQAFDVELPDRARGQLVLRTRDTRGTPEADRPYWTGVTIR
jgi:hypothetical protein